jgi:hypothetical protein
MLTDAQKHNLPELLRTIAIPSFYRKDLEAAADLIEKLTADIAASRRREEWATKLINEVRSDKTGDWGYIMFTIDERRKEYAETEKEDAE